MKIKVMIVDDQVILSEGIRSVLASSDALDVIATAADGKEALDLMEQGQVPDVALLDIRMPNMNGVVTTGEIKKRFPSVKVLILTTFDDSDYILSAINNGACGYLLKDISAPALIDAIKNAYARDLLNAVMGIGVKRKIGADQAAEARMAADEEARTPHGAGPHAPVAPPIY